MIDKIFIHSKKDWRGQKYGFVRYINVEEERTLDIKLDNTWLDGRKIKANISKFKRKVFSNTSEKEPWKKNVGGADEGSDKEGHMMFVLSGPSRGIRNKSISRRYAEIMRDKISSSQVFEEEACKSFFFNSTGEDLLKYGKAMVVITVTPGLTYGVS